MEVEAVHKSRKLIIFRPNKKRASKTQAHQQQLRKSHEPMKTNRFMIFWVWVPIEPGPLRHLLQSPGLTAQKKTQLKGTPQWIAIGMAPLSRLCESFGRRGMRSGQ